jgi:exodeoxyribonuclease VII large subunit
MPMVWDVAALMHAVGDLLATRFGTVAVRGEVSGFTRASSGHCYFTLKAQDGSAAMRCAMFRRAAALLDFAPADGMAVEVRGRVAVYEPRGELQFVVEGMRRDGLGALMEEFLRLKSRLEAEGLFDAARKRVVTLYPRRIGIVTSLAAAALHDVLTALQRRAPHVELLLYPAPVQGAGAGALLAQAVQEASRRAEVDTLIVCRGGGSIEDLWAFNSEALVRAVAAAPMPVVSGVGHETDITLCDFAADLRAPTPTAAAELAAASRDDGLAALALLARRLQRRAHERLEREAQRLDHLVLRWRRPGDLVQVHAQRLLACDQRLRAALPRCLERHQQRLAQRAERLLQAERHQRLLAGQALALRAARLQTLDPRRVLERGYAWVSDEAGRAVVSVHTLQPGQVLTTVLADGRVRSLVDRIEPSPA